MLIEHPGLNSYVMNALEATPEVFERLLRDLSEEEADFRPDAARFSIREVMAHLADWDAIFLERLQRTRDEDEPFLPDIDEGQLVLDHQYARTHPQEQCRLFGERRTRTVEFARALVLQDWQRPCAHERAGRLTLEALLTLIVLHDAYHARQIVAWRNAWQSANLPVSNN